MSRRRRRKLRRDLPWLTAGCLILYLLLEPKYGAGVPLLLVFSVLMLYVLLFVPTRCDYDVDNGRGCVRQVYGNSEAALIMARLKLDAIFSAFSMVNPGTLFRVTWSGGVQKGHIIGHQHRSVPASKSTSSNTSSNTNSSSSKKQGAYNMLMLAVTAIGSLAGVLALFASK